jgi:uncharacterized protein (TIGR02453 family)
MAVMTSTFTGFRPEAIEFLAELAEHNERAWFQPRKADFERLLKHPLEALCVVLDDAFASRGVPLMADPAKSPFRIYRDVRFSKDKSPYKTYVSASFGWAGEGAPRASGKTAEVHGVGGYFHFQPDEEYVGGGMWQPERPRLEAWRALLANHPEQVHKVVDATAFRRAFGELSGELLKRVPPGYAADHPEAELLKLKDVTFGRRLTSDEALSPDLPEILADAFAAAVPTLRLLAGLGT